MLTSLYDDLIELILVPIWDLLRSETWHTFVVLQYIKFLYSDIKRNYQKGISHLCLVHKIWIFFWFTTIPWDKFGYVMLLLSYKSKVSVQNVYDSKFVLLSHLPLLKHSMLMYKLTTHESEYFHKIFLQVFK